jgi:hypothetical protein
VEIQVKKDLMSELKNAAMLRGKIGGSKQGYAALFSKQRSALSSMASTPASSTASSTVASCSQRIALPLASSELVVEGMSSPSSVRYDYMSRAELLACCGKKHGNSISASKKVNEGRWKSKSKKELMSELKNAAMLRRGSARLE